MNVAPRHRAMAEFAAVMGLVALSLVPMLASGFYGDDASGSLITAELLAIKGQSLAEVIVASVAGWMTSVGRFFPLAGYGGVLFWLANGNPLIYKAILMALVMLDAALLYALAKRVAKSTGLAAISVLAFSVTLQFRYYHEPILSYTALLPVITALVLAALICFVGYLESGSTRLLVLSLVSFSATLLIYEVALPMCLVFVGLAVVYPRRGALRKALRASWIYLAIAVAAVANVMVLRIVFRFRPVAEQVVVYQPSLSPAPFVETVVKQLVSAVPLAQYGSRMLAASLGFTTRPLYDAPLAYLQAHPYTTLLSAGLFFAGGLLVLRPFLIQSSSTALASSRALLLIGLGFLVLPNLLTSLSPEHQSVAWGQGYLPVYMSTIGVALLVATAIDSARRSPAVRTRATLFSVILAVVLALVGAVNFDNNRVTVESLNRGQSYPADVSAKAVSAGLLAPVPDGAWLLSNAETPWQVTDFYRLHADKTLAGAVPQTGADSLTKLPLRLSTNASTESTTYVVDPKGPPIFYLFVESGTRDAGYALLSRVESATVTSVGTSVSGTPLLVYRTWPEPLAFDWQEVRGWPTRPASYAPRSTAVPADLGGTTVASGGDWVLEAVPTGWTVTVSGFEPADGRSWLDYAKPEWSRTR